MTDSHDTNPVYQALLLELVRLRFATTSQLARLHRHLYGSSHSALRQTNRHLTHLERSNLVMRLERRVGGWAGGSAPSIWTLTTTGHHIATGQGRKRQRPRLLSTTFLEHLLAIAEACVIVEETITTMADAEAHILTEPECWRSYLGPHGEPLTLRPDLSLQVLTPEYSDRYFLEIDRATENPARIIAKCQQYLRYRRTGAEQRAVGVFPAVLWIVPNSTRRDQLRRHITAAELPAGMFHVLTPDGLPDVMRAGPPSHETEQQGQEGEHPS